MVISKSPPKKLSGYGLTATFSPEAQAILNSGGASGQTVEVIRDEKGQITTVVRPWGGSEGLKKAAMVVGPAVGVLLVYTIWRKSRRHRRRQ